MGDPVGAFAITVVAEQSAAPPVPGPWRVQVMLVSAGRVPPLIVGYVKLGPWLSGSGLLAVPVSSATSSIVPPKGTGPATTKPDDTLWPRKQPVVHESAGVIAPSPFRSTSPLPYGMEFPQVAPRTLYVLTTLLLQSSA